MTIQAFKPTIGGAELQLERLLPRLTSRGITCTVLTRRVPGQPSHEMLGGAHVRRIGLAGRSPLASIAYVTSSLFWLARRRTRVHAVHAHGAKSPATVALGATFLGMRALVLVIGVGASGDFDRVAAKPGGRWRLRMLVSRARFIALSSEARDEIIDQGVEPAAVSTIPNGVDVDAYRPVDDTERKRIRKTLGLKAGAVAVFVGRLHPVKEVDTIVRALERVPELRLVVVGDGSERARLEALAAHVGVLDRIRFEGFSDRVVDFLKAADMFLLPSRREGLSNALLEAMAVGLACVASPASGTAELLGDDRGLVAPAGDVESWADSMRTLARDPALREKLGRKAAEHVRTRYSTEAVVTRLIAAYRSSSVNGT